MAEQEQKQPREQAPAQAAGDGAAEGGQGGAEMTGPEGAGETETAAAAAPGTTGGAAPETAAGTEPETAETSAADVWEAFDAVLQAFGQERGVGVGTMWGEGPAEPAGRFANWANASGWRCTLQLVRAPEENVVVLVAQGPPLPGGRARVMVLGAFPPEFERDTLRAALEVGYGIGETWGPAEEPPEPPAGDAEAPTA